MNIKDTLFMRWMDLTFPESNMEVRRGAFENMKELKKIWLSGYNTAIDRMGVDNCMTNADNIPKRVHRSQPDVKFTV